jgi:hypothetical protein
LDRHAEAEDAAESLSADDPLGLIRHVWTRKALPGDIVDALELLQQVHAWLKHAELGLLQAGHRQGVTWDRLAHALGLESRQAALQRKRRLKIAVDTGLGSAAPARAMRARARGDDRQTRAQARRQAPWAERNTRAVRAATEAVAARPASYTWSEEARDFAEMLAELAYDPDASPAEMMAWLSLLADDWHKHARADTPG